MEIELLYKKIEGTLTSEEADEVEAWLHDSPEHLAYFERLKIHYHERNDYVVSPDIVNGFRMGYDRIITARSRKRKWLGFSVGMVAACFLVLAVMGIVFFTQTDNIPAPAQESVAEIAISLPAPVYDTVPVYTEKKTNGKVTLSVGGKKIYGLSEIYGNHVESVEYDVENSMVYYKESAKRVPSEVHRLSTEPGAELCLRLEDGTVVWLNSDTEIEFPSYFAEDARRVALKGEAYFEVSKDSIRPFIVSTDNVDVKVYGTEFNINTRRDNMTTTTLVEGSVSIVPADSGTETLLIPGETGRFDHQTGCVAVCEDDIDLYIGWRQGAYHFSNNSLESLFNEISLWYDIEVSFSDNNIKNELFSGIISRKMPLNDLLNILTMTNYVEFELKGKKLIVKEINKN